MYASLSACSIYASCILHNSARSHQTVNLAHTWCKINFVHISMPLSVLTSKWTETHSVSQLFLPSGACLLLDMMQNMKLSVKMWESSSLYQSDVNTVQDMMKLEGCSTGLFWGALAYICFDLSFLHVSYVLQRCYLQTLRMLEFLT